MEHTHNSIFSICHSPQKSSVAQKVYKPPLCPTSPSRLRRATSPSRGGFGSPRKVNGFARGSPTRGAVERSETERLYEGKPDREPPASLPSPSLLRNATSPKGRGFGRPKGAKNLSEIAAPRGAGYLAEFHFLLDITFRIEHRKLCEVPILYVSISNIPNIARCFTTVGQHNVIFVSSVSFAQLHRLDFACLF